MDEQSIKEILQKHFKVESIHVENDSARHKRHKESQGKGGHFKLVIVSDDFSNMDLVSRHRKIYEALGMKDNISIHALAISAWTKEEWMKRNPR